MLSNQVGDGIYCYQRKKVSVYCAITRTNMVNCGRSFQYHIYGAVGLCPTMCVYWQDKVLPENINIKDLPMICGVTMVSPLYLTRRAQNLFYQVHFVGNGSR